MIAKISLIALLAVVATAQPLCGRTVVAPSCGSSSSNVQVALASSGSSLSAVSSSGSSSSGAEVRNVVAKGKYPVALKNCGPTPDRQVPVTTTRVNAPARVKPTVRLPCNIPAPKVVCHTCTCYKTVLRPRVNQQIITVPTIERYIETTHKPVIENIQYEAIPVNCGDESSGGVQLVEVGSSGSSSQAVEIPQEVQAVQSVQVPQVQTVEIPQVQTVQVPQVQTVQVPQVQTVQVPQVQTVQVPQVQTVQVPQVQTVQVPQVQTVQVPQVQTVQVPQFQSVQVPQSVSFGSSCNSC